jgi:hypothetical protein
VIALRKVPRGAFGNDTGTDSHKFYVEFKKDYTGTANFTLRVTGRDPTSPNVDVYNEMRVIRNPDSTELTVAVWNMYYYDGDDPLFVDGRGAGIGISNIPQNSYAENTRTLPICWLRAPRFILRTSH